MSYIADPTPASWTDRMLDIVIWKILEKLYQALQARRKARRRADQDRTEDPYFMRDQGPAAHRDAGAHRPLADRSVGTDVAYGQSDRGIW